MTGWAYRLSKNSTHLFYAYSVIAYNLVMLVAFQVNFDHNGITAYAWYATMFLNVIGSLMLTNAVVSYTFRPDFGYFYFWLLNGYRFLFYASLGFAMYSFLTYLSAQPLWMKLAISIPAMLMEWGQIRWCKAHIAAGEHAEHCEGCDD